MAALLRLSRALVALLLAASVAAPNLDGCLCGLWSQGSAELEDCCAGLEAEVETDALTVRLEGDGCCCAGALAPLSEAAASPGVLPPLAHEQFSLRPPLAAASGALPFVPLASVVSRIRPPSGPDPSPPLGLRVRLGVILIV